MYLKWISFVDKVLKTILRKSVSIHAEGNCFVVIRKYSLSTNPLVISEGSNNRAQLVEATAALWLDSAVGHKTWVKFTQSWL